MKIGDIFIPAGAGLSPMAGVTDMPFREICASFGASYGVTEMVSAKGFLCAPPGTRQVEELLLRSPKETICGLQIFGHEPDVMAEAALRLQARGFSFFDINMGCPAKKIVSGGDGSALMKYPDRACAVARAVVKAVSCPVTVKMRAGWHPGDQNAAELAKRLEGEGVSAITVHGRTREQFYGGEADWSVIRDAARAVEIPVIGNGDIFSGRDAVKMLDQTGCAGVAVGRAARGNPWIFDEILCALSGRTVAPPTFAERLQMALRQFDREIEIRGERGAVLEMRKHIAWYLQGAPGCAKLRARINMLERAEDVRCALMEEIV